MCAVAENPYYKRDFRRAFPKTEVVTQGELAKLLIAQGGFQACVLRSSLLVVQFTQLTEPSYPSQSPSRLCSRRIRNNRDHCRFPRPFSRSSLHFHFRRRWFIQTSYSSRCQVPVRCTKKLTIFLLSRLTG